MGTRGGDVGWGHKVGTQDGDVRWGREDVCSGHGVGHQKIGKSERWTNANVTRAHQTIFFLKIVYSRDFIVTQNTDISIATFLIFYFTLTAPPLISLARR